VEYVPLSLACKHPPVVRYLLAMKAIINNRAGNGQTALHVAAHWYFCPLISFLIQLVLTKHLYCLPPVSVIVKRGQLATVKLLIEAKADPNDRTSAGGSALAQACMNENKDAPDVVEYLLSKGCQLPSFPSCRLTSIFVGASPDLSFGQGGTMLHETRHPKVATLLLDRGNLYCSHSSVNSHVLM
jgi:ankyrin repeat protein